MKTPQLRGHKRPEPHRVTVDTDDLYSFVRESNAIERIFRDPTDDEMKAAREFIEREVITVDTIKELVWTFQPGANLRDRPGMNVSIAGHAAPNGGPEIVERLKDLLVAAQSGKLNTFETYMEYEDLHPFMDGNGRSGRALWAWKLLRSAYAHWFAMGFRNAFHYQVFPAWRAWKRGRRGL